MATHLTPVGPTAPQAPSRDCPPLLQLLDRVHHHMVKRVSVAVGGSAKLDEWAVLSALSDGVGHPMGQIADITHTPPPTMTKLIDRLVASGLVYRRTDPVDRRRVLVFPTARGRSRYRRLRSLVDASIASLADDEQLRELVGSSRLAHPWHHTPGVSARHRRGASVPTFISGASTTEDDRGDARTCLDIGLGLNIGQGRHAVWSWRACWWLVPRHQIPGAAESSATITPTPSPPQANSPTTCSHRSPSISGPHASRHPNVAG